MVKDLDKGLIPYGGFLLEIHKVFNLENEKDVDIIHIDDDTDEVATGVTA